MQNYQKRFFIFLYKKNPVFFHFGINHGYSTYQLFFIGVQSAHTD